MPHAISVHVNLSTIFTDKLLNTVSKPEQVVKELTKECLCMSLA